MNMAAKKAGVKKAAKKAVKKSAASKTPQKKEVPKRNSFASITMKRDGNGPVRKAVAGEVNVLDTQKPGLADKITAMLDIVPPDIRDKIRNLLINEGPRAAELALIASLPRVKNAQMKIAIKIMIGVLAYINRPKA